jgi:AraC-like DNA-binding protein
MGAPRDRLAPGATIARHRHAEPYAALVLSGGYEECGSAGRFRARPGDVLIHAAFDAHLDRIAASGAEVLNLALPALPAAAKGRIADADSIARLATQSATHAAEELLRLWQPAAEPEHDWPDRLAAALRRDPNLRLDDWAEDHHLAPETLSRGFARIFGISPSAYRLEARTARAFAAIAGSLCPLAEIALATGFADQSHMTRAIRRLTGGPPGRWRSNPFKTAGATRH